MFSCPVAPATRPSKKRIASAFGRKAASYDANAVIQARLIERLLPKVAAYAAGKGVWVDLGCGTGLLERKYINKACPIRFIGLDMAGELLRHFRKNAHGPVHAVQGDIERLPFKAGAFDGAVIASVLQWLDDFNGALETIGAMLRVEGHLVFSAFVKGSFRELFKMHAAAGMRPPVVCPEPEQIIAGLKNAGFDVLDQETVRETIHFPDARSLLRCLNLIGGTATAAKPLGKKSLARFCGDYESAFRSESGVPLTFRAMLGICRKRI